MNHSLLPLASPPEGLRTPRHITPTPSSLPLSPENAPGRLISPPHFWASGSWPRLFKDKTVLPMPVALGGLLSGGLQTKTVALFRGRRRTRQVRGSKPPLPGLYTRVCTLCPVGVAPLRACAR